MLRLNNIIKEYSAKDFHQTALKNINLIFKKKEFVAILGPSGSGKTTLLNIIGGLDRYDHGDLVINGKSTESFKDHDWDAYRNNAVGFIFQSYNLIMHISVIANVEIGLTLSGISPEERRTKAIGLLDRVGLSEHIHKKPSQLSGGQMQRVAIARALANDPDIILADEPTGALDSLTSVQIMELIRDIAKDKLVIMVTHNRDVAEKYANRIIQLLDGQVVSDSAIEEKAVVTQQYYEVRRTSMSYKQALKLSFNNLKMKKIRTLITAFAGSIGIIGVALVLSISRGLGNEIEHMETTTLSDFPLVVPATIRNINITDGTPFSTPTPQVRYTKFPTKEIIYNYDSRERVIDHTNIFTDEYIEYIDNMSLDLINEMFYIRELAMNIIMKRHDGAYRAFNRSNAGFSELLSNIDFFNQTYDVLYGESPTEIHELVLVVDEYNRLDIRILEALGLDVSNDEFSFEDIVGMTFKLLLNDDYYLFNESTQAYSVKNLQTLYANDDAITLEIVAIARIKPSTDQKILRTGLKHLPTLTDAILENSKESSIALFQNLAYTHAITGASITPAEKSRLLRTFGADSKPVEIRIYAKDFGTKNQVKAYLDEYNRDLVQVEQIIYVDQAAIITDTIGTVVDTTTIVLIAFSAISLVVSSIMIGVITYISVLERTKEIGILRSLGARKRDITRVFNAETSIVGFGAGIMGVSFAYILSYPIDLFIGHLVEGMEKLSKLTPLTAVTLIFISILLTFISGLIPALIASRKNPVEALRE